MSTVKLCTLKICAALVTDVIVTVLYTAERDSSTRRRLVVEDQEQRKRIVVTIHDSRATERIGGAQGKYKKWGPTKWIV